MNVKIEHEIHIKVDKDVEELISRVAIYSEVAMRKRLVNGGVGASLASAHRGAGADAVRLGSKGGSAKRWNGYLAPLRQDKETLALVKQINAARSESYQQLADDNNLPVDEVAKMAGQKLVSRAQPGGSMFRD